MLSLNTLGLLEYLYRIAVQYICPHLYCKFRTKAKSHWSIRQPIIGSHSSIHFPVVQSASSHYLLRTHGEGQGRPPRSSAATLVCLATWRRNEKGSEWVDGRRLPVTPHHNKEPVGSSCMKCEELQYLPYNSDLNFSSSSSPHTFSFFSILSSLQIASFFPLTIL